MWVQIGTYLADNAIHIATLGVLIVGLYIACKQISEGRKTTYYDFVWRTHEEWSTPEFVEARALIGKIRKRCGEDKEKIAQILFDYYKRHDKRYFVISGICNYFEALGDLVVHKRMLDAKDIKIAKEIAKFYWENIFKGFVKRVKDKEKRKIYSNFKDLYNLLQKSS